MLEEGRALGQERSRADEPRRHLYVIASMLRRWKVIAFSAAVALVLAALFFALKPVTYTASTQLLIYNRELSPGPDAVILPGRADTALVENMIEILKSRNVLAKVIETLKLNEDADVGSGRSLLQIIRGALRPASSELISVEDKIFERSIERFRQAMSVKRVGTSHTVFVTYTSIDPQKAAAVANEIAASAARVFKGTESASSGTSPLRERLQRLGPSAYVISEADPPVRPDGPRRATLGALFLLAGLSLGIALALFLDFQDRTIRTAAQVEGVLGLECVGTVARTPSQPFAVAPGPRAALMTGGSDPWPPSLGQALRRAHTVTDSILAVRTVGVTSIVRREGASFMAVGLARIAADTGKKVLLIKVAKDGAIGSSGASTTAGSGADGDTADTGFGSQPCERGSSFTLVSTDRLDESMRDAPGYDLVIVDLPPLASDTAVREAAHEVEGILLVLEWGRHRADQVRRALELSGVPSAKFVGVILNSGPKNLIGRYGDALAGLQARLASRSSGTRATTAGEKTDEQGGELAPA